MSHPFSNMVTFIIFSKFVHAVTWLHNKKDKAETENLSCKFPLYYLQKYYTDNQILRNINKKNDYSLNRISKYGSIQKLPIICAILTSGILFPNSAGLTPWTDLAEC